MKNLNLNHRNHNSGFNKGGNTGNANYNDNDYTVDYEDMIKIDYDEHHDVKKVKTNIPFFKYKITPK